MLPIHPSDPVRRALRLKVERGVAGAACGRQIARGGHWIARDIICSSGPRDQPFEERHDWASVAVVVSGSFTYGNEHGRALLTPGSLLLGGAGGCFTCGHEHSEGDRCISFHFEPSLFEEIVSAAGARSMAFGGNSLPALRSLAPLVARATLAAEDDTVTSLAIEELGLELAAAALRETGEHRSTAISKRDERRVAAIARFIEERFAEPCALSDLARHAGLSPFHFLRVFRATTGLTPHQHLLRTRLRAAARHLAGSNASVTDIALAIGFEDLSNFTRSFRAEHGHSPLQYRARFQGPKASEPQAPRPGPTPVISRRTSR